MAHVIRHTKARREKTRTSKQLFVYFVYRRQNKCCRLILAQIYIRYCYFITCCCISLNFVVNVSVVSQPQFNPHPIRRQSKHQLYSVQFSNENNNAINSQTVRVFEFFLQRFTHSLTKIGNILCWQLFEFYAYKKRHQIALVKGHKQKCTKFL